MKVVCGIHVGDMKAREENVRGKVGIVEVPVKEVGPGDVKIKVAYCSICGSDPHIVGGAFGLTPPFGLGHEMSGVIVELGEEAKIRGLRAGDKVSGNFLRYCGACYHCVTGNQQFCENAGNEPCMAEYVVWHESQVVKLPEGVSLLEGCLLEPLSIGVRIVDKSKVRLGDRVLISGGGPIGLIVSQLFAKRGVAALTLSEPNQERCKIARAIGVEHTVNPLTEDLVARGLEITGGLGYDTIVEVSGMPGAAETVITLAAHCGTVIYSAMFPNQYEMPVNLYKYFYSKELTVTGTYCAHYNFERAAQMLPQMELGAFGGRDQIFDIDDCEAAFAAHLSGKYPKVVIRCNRFDGE